MPRRASADLALRTVSEAQRGLVTAAQLRDLRIPPGTVAYRSRPGGMWSRLLPGIHLVSGGTPDRDQRELAALLYGGTAAVLTGLTTLRHLGLRSARLQESGDDREQPEPVFVLIPHAQRRASTSFVRIERTRRMPESDEMSGAGLPLAPAARALADASRRLRREADVTALVTESVRRGLVSVSGLRAEVGDGPVRGSAYLRAALDHVVAGVWSSAEGDLRNIVLTTGLPEPRWNITLLTRQGMFVAIPDAWFDEVGLALEVDSREHHADGHDWERTLGRQRRYAEAGVAVLPVTPAELRRSPVDVALSIERAYRAAASRPRPAVRMLKKAAALGGREPSGWGG